MKLNIIGFWASRGFYQVRRISFEERLPNSMPRLYYAYLQLIRAGLQEIGSQVTPQYTATWIAEKKKVVITIVCISNDNEVLAASLVHKTRFCENRLVFTYDHTTNLAFNFSRSGKELTSD